LPTVADGVGTASLLPGARLHDDDRMDIALALYPGFTALDIVGPFQTLVDVPGVEAGFVAATAGPVTDHTGRLTLVAARSFADVTAPDVIVVPGGMVAPAGPGDPVVAWIRAVHPATTWTTSVCTGSLFLAAAGVLDGVDATGHWAAMDQLAALGAHPAGQRVVERGKVITAAGVSSGIDMGLTLVARLYGDDMARAIQLAIEYDPQPPFDAGAPDKVEVELRELVRASLAID
jgi:transcriptional regulator GlxA family with amidase domain